MSHREFCNAIDGAREVRQFELEQDWKRSEKIISLLAMDYLSQFQKKDQAKARQNIEAVLSDKREKTKPKIGYTLAEIEELEADALRTADRMNKQINKNGTTGP